MIDRYLLFPYCLALKLRHALYDKGILKSSSADVPTISFGNVTVGGTGKTPHTEMTVRMLLEDAPGKNVAVLSRGYRRKSRGFQQVVAGEDVALAGDEPLQIKNKFPEVTVAVDADRVEGCEFLCHPDRLATSKKGKKCQYKTFPPADIIVLDDALQHRKLKPALSVMLVDYGRPVFRDMLLPAGRLRDLAERIHYADVIIVSKCPSYLEDWEKRQWAASLGISGFDTETCTGTCKTGRRQILLFTTVGYGSPTAIFPEADSHYIYAKRAVLFSGIADDSPLQRHLSDSYKISSHIQFGDHHYFSAADIRSIGKAADSNPTAIIVTTEKDSQRIRGLSGIPETLKKRMFQVPVKAEFLSENETNVFRTLLKNLL